MLLKIPTVRKWTSYSSYIPHHQFTFSFLLTISYFWEHICTNFCLENKIQMWKCKFIRTYTSFWLAKERLYRCNIVGSYILQSSITVCVFAARIQDILMVSCTDYGSLEKKWPSLHGRKFNPNPNFLGTAEAYFVCHIGPIFQISLIYTFIGCP